MIKSIQFFIALLSVLLTTNVNASVLNTLNGTGYEWLELTATQGLSVDQVKLMMDAATPGDLLYGYEYASRSLMEDLLKSYAPWDGLTGLRSNPSDVSGFEQFITDFGVTDVLPGDGIDEFFRTVDGDSVAIDSRKQSIGNFGVDNECGRNGVNQSCFAIMPVFYNSSGIATAADRIWTLGWDSTITDPIRRSNFVVDPTSGNFLVRQHIVPIPPALWLFGSGLLGLIGLAQRK